MYSYLSESQREAINVIANGDNILITGPAGTGKSYLLQYIKKEFSNKKLHVTATTGIAAVNINGVTLHSWANFGIESIPLNEIIKNMFSARGTYVRKKLQNAEMLAIDEVSMLSKTTFEMLDELLKRVRGNEDPFGGLQLILFGDFFQLPPVKDTCFCFESEIWQDANIKIVELKETFRQKDDKFLKLLNNIRLGYKDPEDIKVLKERFNAIDENSLIKPTILTTHNLYADGINRDYLQNIAQEEVCFTAEFDGRKDKIEFLKKNCIAPEFLNLKVDAQVMMLKNTYQKDNIINGSIGIVVDFSSKKEYPIVQFQNGEIKTITPATWEIQNFNSLTKEMVIDASMEQIPLRLAWAITIHKSQGMTLDKIECDLKDTFTEGQIYVALSRVRDLEGLFIKSFNINNLKINKKVIEFYKKNNCLV